MIEATPRAEQDPKPLRVVVAPNHPVIWPIELTGLDKVLTLDDSVDDARAEHHPT